MAKVVEMTKAYQIWAKRCIVAPYPKKEIRMFFIHTTF